MQLTKCNLLAEILHELTQLPVCEAAMHSLDMMQSTSTQLGVTNW